MRQIYIIGIIVLFFSSCNFEKKPSQTLVFCENELNLLCYDSLAPVTNYELAEFRSDVWNKLDSIFEVFYCRQVRLKINSKIDSVNQVKILLYSSNFINCDSNNEVPPPFNPYVHWIHIYLNKNDSLYIRRQLSSLDSVKNEVINRYHELPIEKYFKVNIALLWDFETDRKKFSQLIYDCLKGYIFIANEVSLDIFQKPVCNLTKSELEELNNKVPFKLRTDFWGGVPENYDFVGHELPPPPLESEMEIINLLEDGSTVPNNVQK